MRLVCIIDGNWIKVENKEPTTGPAKGDVITKSSEYVSKGIIYYRLVEWPDGGGFASNLFLPLNESSQKEEMKLVEFTEIKKEVPISSN